MKREDLMPFYIKEKVTSTFEDFCDFNRNISKDEMALLTDINDTYVTQRYDSFLQMFNSVVQLYGNDIAVRFEEQSITFKELDDLSNRIATYLINNEVHIGDKVLFASERCIEMVVSIIGIVKTGAIYVPIDYNIPELRLAAILEDCGANVILKTSDRINFKIESVKELVYSVIESPNIAQLSEITVTSDMPMYIIYTSGTTGIPKGVIITHGNFVNYCDNNPYNVFGKYCNPIKKTMLSVTSITFDIFMMESLGALVNGYSVLVADEIKRINWEELKKQVEKYNIQAIQTTPSIMRIFLKKDEELSFLKNFKCILLGGEACEIDIVKKIRNVTSADIINCYGPTETTVFSTYYSIEKVCDAVEIPVGLPIANTQIFIINHNGYRCKIGEEGEICIAGDGVFSSYTDLRLKNEKMVYIPDISAFAYRTGDVGLIKADGLVYCRGRLDQQVKINGNRIELDEIKNTISSYCSFDYINVKVETINSRKVICAYYIAAEEINRDAITLYLKKRLPAVMIPLYWIRLKSIELNGNGKFSAKNILDRVISQTEDYLSITEKEIFDAIKKVTGLSVAREDNLLECGIDSLNFIVILLELEEKGYKLAFTDFYTYKTIAAIASYLDEHSAPPVKLSKSQTDIFSFIGDTFVEKSMFLSIAMQYDLNFKSCGIINQTRELKHSLKLLSQKDRVSDFLIDIPSNIQLDVLLDGLRLVIENTVSFRTACNPATKAVVELTMPKSMCFEVIDKKDFSREDLRSTVDLMKSPFQINNICEYNMLSKFFIIRHSEGYKVLLLIHHILWDQMSEGILINLLEKALSLKNEIQPTESLINYLEKIPNNNQNIQLINYLDDFQMKASEFSSSLSGLCLNEFYSEIELDGITMEAIVRDPLRASVLMQFLVIKTENPKLAHCENMPMLVAMNNRTQDNRNIIAEMADHIPIMICPQYNGSDIHQRVDEVLKIRKNNFVRFGEHYEIFVKEFIPINNLSLSGWDKNQFAIQEKCSVWTSKLKKATQRYRWSFMPKNGSLIIKCNSFCSTAEEFEKSLSFAIKQFVMLVHNENNEYRVEKAIPAHLEAISNIYVDAFAKREKVTIALGTDETVAKWYCDNYFSKYILDGYINVAIHSPTEKVVGFTLSVPDNQRIYLGKATEELFALCREGLLADTKFKRNGLHHIFVGVDREHLGKGVHLKLAKYNIKKAQEEGYEYLFAECTNEKSANGLLKLGYTKQYSVRYCDSKIPSLIGLDGECVVMVKTFE